MNLDEVFKSLGNNAEGETNQVLLSDAVKILIDEVKLLKVDVLDAVKSQTGILQFIKELNEEVKELKKVTLRHRLLIEHEERVRTVKEPKVRVKTIAPKFKIGDRVIHRSKGKVIKGTIQQIKGQRALLRNISKAFDTRANQGDIWCTLLSLEHSTIDRKIN